MKKNRLFNVLFIFISVLNLVCIIGFTVCIGISLKKNGDNTVFFNDDMTVLLQEKYEIKRGDFTKKRALSANIVLRNDAFQTISNLDDNYLSTGDVFEKNQPVGLLDNQPVLSIDSGIVVDVINDSNSTAITLYNFNHFYIEVSVDAELFYSFDFDKDIFCAIINGQTKIMSVTGFDLSKVGDYGIFIIKFSIENTNSIVVSSSLQGAYKEIATFNNTFFLPKDAFNAIGTTKVFYYVDDSEIKTALIKCKDIIDGCCLIESLDSDLTKIEFLYGK